MIEQLQTVSSVAFRIIYVILLGFLIGIVRESSSKTKLIKFGGARTYPIIALMGCLLAQIDNQWFIPFITGLVIIGVILSIYYHHHISKEQTGIISELSALMAYIIGGLAAQTGLWQPLAVTIVVILLIQSRIYLENLAVKIPPKEIVTFIKFLLLSIVILPVFPDRNFTQINLNPFRIWLLVVVVSGFSYISYLIQYFLKGKGGVLIFSIFGGAYSSTVTTIVLAKQLGELSVNTGESIRRFAGIILASSIMYLRILVLLFIFNRDVAIILTAPFLATSIVGIVVALIITIHGKKAYPMQRGDNEPVRSNHNPLDLGAAMLFVGLFTAVTMANHFLKKFAGVSGIYAISVIMGVTDVDPFILSIVQGSDGFAIQVMAIAIILTTASNNLLKGIYAYIFSRNKAGFKAIIGLLLLSGWSMCMYYFFVHCIFGGFLLDQVGV